MWCTYTLKSLSVVRKKAILPFTTRMGLECFMLSEMSQTVREILYGIHTSPKS